MKLLKTKEVTLRGFIDIYEAKESSDIIWVVGEQIMAACGFYKPEKDLKKLLETYEPEFRGLTLEAEVTAHGFNNRKVLFFNFHGAMKLCAATRKFGAQEVIDKLFEAIQNLEHDAGDVQPFKYENKQLRVIKDDEQTLWFVAKDIAEALEYSEASLKQMNNLLASVPAIWADHKRIMVRSENGVKQERDMLCLSEQGLYFFLGRSDKPKALPYQMWIAGEVVPSIRKTGSYSLKSKKKDLPLPERIDLTPCYFYTLQEVAEEADITYNQLEKLIKIYGLSKYIIWIKGDKRLTYEGRYEILTHADDFHELENLG